MLQQKTTTKRYPMQFVKVDLIHMKKKKIINYCVQSEIKMPPEMLNN